MRREIALLGAAADSDFTVGCHGWISQPDRTEILLDYLPGGCLDTLLERNGAAGGGQDAAELGGQRGLAATPRAPSWCRGSSARARRRAGAGRTGAPRGSRATRRSESGA